MQTEFDYIVAGAGSAGAIVAARLAEHDATSVLLLEAGPKDRSLLFHVPAAIRYAYNVPKYNWNYVTEPEPFLNGRILVQPRGKVLGGSSSINGQLYLRGHPLDYDGWADAGARGWSYAEVLPYFRRLETRVDGNSAYQGHGGRIKASTMGGDHPLTRAFLAAGREAGYLESDDVNGAQQDGFGLLPKNVADGRRSSTARCYLRDPPANLHVRTGCHVRALVIENRVAKGIRFVRDGQNVTATARREVILSAGAFNSPLILMQSGIGPAAQLRKHGIEVVRDLPGVGENLMDHPLTSLQIKCTKPVTLYRHLNLFSQAKGALEWALARKGLLASNHFDAVCFIRTRAGIRSPNLQIALFQIAVAEGSADFVREHAFQLQFTNQRPQSRGYVRLASNDPFAAPRIRYNLLERREDVDELTAGLKLSRELLSQASLASFGPLWRAFHSGQLCTTLGEFPATCRAPRRGRAASCLRRPARGPEARLREGSPGHGPFPFDFAKGRMDREKLLAGNDAGQQDRHRLAVLAAAGEDQRGRRPGSFPGTPGEREFLNGVRS